MLSSQINKMRLFLTFSLLLMSTTISAQVNFFECAKNPERCSNPSNKPAEKIPPEQKPIDRITPPQESENEMRIRLEKEIRAKLAGEEKEKALAQMRAKAEAEDRARVQSLAIAEEAARKKMEAEKLDIERKSKSEMNAKETVEKNNKISTEVSRGTAKAKQDAWNSMLQGFKNKIDEFELRGRQIAEKSNSKFRLQSKTDQLTGVTTETATLQQQVGGGSLVTEIYCREGNVSSQFTIHNTQVPVQNNGTLSVRKRINGKVYNSLIRQDSKWSNVFRVDIGRVNGKRIREDGSASPFSLVGLRNWLYSPTHGWFEHYFFGGEISNSILNEDKKLADAMSEARQCTADCSVNIKQSYADIIHDFAIDIQTSAGNAFVEIPPYNPAILKVIESCKSPAQPILLNQLVFEIGVDDMNRRTFGSPVKIIYD